MTPTPANCQALRADTVEYRYEPEQDAGPGDPRELRSFGWISAEDVALALALRDRDREHAGCEDWRRTFRRCERIAVWVLAPLVTLALLVICARAVWGALGL